MPEDSNSLLKIVNSSGYLFQLAVENAIQKSHLSDWAIPAREHRWVDPISKDEGFIDLVLKSGITRMMIECKRKTDATWIFLLPDSQKVSAQARLFWTHQQLKSPSISNWDDFVVFPESYETMFCTIRGHDNSDKSSMLERIAGPLLRSVECLAAEELGFEKEDEIPADVARLYIPVIITNATLQTCRFNVENVDLHTGNLLLENAIFETVEAIKFHKNLSTTNSLINAIDLQYANRVNERTIFVINSDAFPKILNEWRVKNLPQRFEWPWHISRARKHIN